MARHLPSGCMGVGARALVFSGPCKHGHNARRSHNIQRNCAHTSKLTKFHFYTTNAIPLHAILNQVHSFDPLPDTTHENSMKVSKRVGDTTGKKKISKVYLTNGI